jgi:hypothetical protein
MARDGARVVEVEGPVEMRYGVQGFGIGEGR